MKSFFSFVIAAALLGAASLRGAEPVAWPEWRAPMLADFSGDVKKLDAALQAAPDSISLLSQRGDRNLFLGKFAEAVADYEKMIALDPAQDAPHWRLGIAYYFLGHIRTAVEHLNKAEGPLAAFYLGQAHTYLGQSRQYADDDGDTTDHLDAAFKSAKA